MSILKLKNCLIVTVLLSAAGYCADDENEDFFPPPALLRANSSLAMSEPELVSDAVKYCRLLKEYLESEQQRRLARQRWDKNILNGIRTLQNRDSAARDDLDETSKLLPDRTVEYLELLKEHTKSKQHRRLARQRWDENILNGISALRSREITAQNESQRDDDLDASARLPGVSPLMHVVFDNDSPFATRKYPTPRPPTPFSAAPNGNPALPLLDVDDGDSSGLITPASYIRQQDAAPLGDVSDAATDDDLTVPASYVGAPLPLVRNDSVARIPTPISVADSPTSSRSGSTAASERSDDSYVSDSDDEVKQAAPRGFFRRLLGL